MLITVILLLSSCGTKNNDTIQIWLYDYNHSGGYTEAINNIVTKLGLYCTANNIPFEIIRYGENTLSHQDYVLKRNTAMASGNMIILDDARNLHDIANNHADYSKLENYDKLLDVYKNRFCIPAGVGYRAIAINNKIMEHYGISTQRNVISYYDYLELKQQMKEKGAKFKLNEDTHFDVLQYYMIKNNIRYLDENSEILKNKDKFKSAIKKTIIDSYEDFKLYYEDIKDFSHLQQESGRSFYAYDETSDLKLLETYTLYFLSSYSDFAKLNDDIINKTFVISDSTFNSPCAYMYKKVTNDKIYDVFNQILDESYYKAIGNINQSSFYFPVMDAEPIRQLIKVDENWEYTGFLKSSFSGESEKDVKLLNTMNDIFEMMVKNNETANHIAGYYFSNEEFNYKIRAEINYLLSKLIIGNLDYNEKEVDDMINKEIDDFIINFNIHYN